MYKVADCPPEKTVFAWIAAQEGWAQGATRYEPDIQIPGFGYDRDKLLADLSQLAGVVELQPWRSQAPGAVYGMSLHRDPNGPEDEKYCGSFGHPRYKSYSAEDYFKVPMTDLPSARKGDYLDELAFRAMLPEVRALPELSRVLSWFSRPVVRGTLRVILGDRAFPSLADSAGMHTDQPPEMAVRINLTVQSSPNFGLEYEGRSPIFTDQGGYRVVCTDINHRIFVRQPDQTQRIHVVFDVVPWLDYDEQNDAWVPNEFFMKKHPYDMIVDGDFGPKGVA